MRGTSRTGSSASRNGSEPATPATSATTDDDVLERLARLGDVAPPSPEPEPAGLPTIVEADPTYPPLAMASTGLVGTTLLDGLHTVPDSTTLIEPLATPSLVPDTNVEAASSRPASHSACRAASACAPGWDRRCRWTSSR